MYVYNYIHIYIYIYKYIYIYIYIYILHPSRNPAGLLCGFWFPGSGSLVPEFLGSLVLWFPSSFVPEFLGSLVPWFPGSLVSWFPGSLVSWFLVPCTLPVDFISWSHEKQDGMLVFFLYFVFFVWVPFFKHLCWISMVLGHCWRSFCCHFEVPGGPGVENDTPRREGRKTAEKGRQFQRKRQFEFKTFLLQNLKNQIRTWCVELFWVVCCALVFCLFSWCSGLLKWVILDMFDMPQV